MDNRTADSPDYDARKQAFNNLITLYGRQVVLSVLEDPDVEIFRLHLADSNARGDTIEAIERLGADC